MADLIPNPDPDGADVILPAPTISRILPAKASNVGGTPLTIYGDNFQSGTTVTIGGTPCGAVSVASKNLITCTSPAKAKTCGATDVVVTNPDQQAAADPTGFVFRPASVQFASTASYPLPPSPNSLVSADFNGDGILDIVSTRQHTDYIVFLGKGNGTFQNGVTYPLIRSGHIGGIPEAGDFNGDGKPDILFGYSTPFQLSLLPGRGDGTFSELIDISLKQKPVGFAFGDLNGDNILDVVVSPDTDDGPNISILLGTRSGRFNPLAPYPYPGGNNVDSVYLGDMNRDGKLDLIIVEAIRYQISVALGNGDGTFQTAKIVAPPWAWPVPIIATDLNGDRRGDIVAVYPDSVGLGVMLGDEMGTMGPIQRIPVPVVQGFNAPRVADFNDDGVPDIMVLQSLPTTLVYLEGKNAGGTYAPASIFPLRGSIGPAVLGDFDGDLLLDILIATYDGPLASAPRTLQVFLQQCN